MLFRSGETSAGVKELNFSLLFVEHHVHALFKLQLARTIYVVFHK